MIKCNHIYKLYRTVIRIMLILYITVCSDLTLYGQQTSRARLDSLINLADKSRGTEKIDLLLDISQMLWYFNSFEESMNYAVRGLQLAEELNSSARKADALNRIGNVHYFLRNHDNVIESYNMALEIAIELDDDRRKGIYLNNIGLLYYELEQYDSAEVYLIRALDAKELHGEPELIYSTLGNLGALYRDKGKYDVSLHYFSRQLEIQQTKEDPRSLAVVHRQTGEVFFMKGQHIESLSHLMISLDFAQETNDTLLIASAHYHIARSLLELDRKEEALESINRSIDLAASTTSLMLMSNNYHLLYQYNKANRDHQAAFENLVKHSKLKDSVRTIQSNRRIQQLEAIYETEKKNSMIELLRRENEIQELNLNRQNTFKIILALVLASLATFLVIIAFRYRIIVKTSRLLKKKAGELEETNEKLRISTITLEQLNATKNRFFSIIAHDLKNPFNALLGFSDIMVSDFNRLEGEELREYIRLIHQSSQNLYKLLENLLKWSASQTGMMHFIPERFDLVSQIHSEISFFRISARKKNITIFADIPDELFVSSDKPLLSSVIRNLIDNAIKFTREDGRIDIALNVTGNEVVVRIDDTGIGIPHEMQQRLFRIDGNTSRKGTFNEQGGGLGLILCKELIDKAGGKLGFESEPGAGSSFWFSLPLNYQPEK
ncbi:MAG: hypothetical protein EA408_06430 [Marinilabiliales bacterium]|nr:MAG: hypothetical protein EA408_06430 [Marinilabiliales bacterium]